MTAGDRARASLAPYFPLPLVWAAVLLAVLILLTPNLLSTGSPSAGSIESQAELLVDRAPSGDNVTHLYLRGLGLARYERLELTWIPLNGTQVPSSLDGLTGGVTVNGTELLSLNTTTPATGFGVNASAEYVDPSGASVGFAGSWAFVWSGGLLVTTSYGSDGGANPLSPSQMPLVLLLPQEPSGGGS